jgi:hypothetical protein
MTTPTTPVTPVDPTIGQTTTLASVSELVEQADRLGLTWSLRPGLVVRTDDIATPFNPNVRMDGDDLNTLIATSSLVGAVAVGMRVMVMQVPPVGNYIIGIMTVDDLRPRVFSATSSSATITLAEILMATLGGVRFLGGAAYRVRLGTAFIGGTTAFTQFNVRKTNLAGALWTSSPVFQGIGLATANCQWVGYLRNTSPSTITTDVALTAAAFVLTTTWFGSTTIPRYFSIEYCGAAADYPHAATVT